MIRDYTASDTDVLIDIWEKANALAHPFLARDFVAFVKDAMRTACWEN
jgi:putative acetyltransferase